METGVFISHQGYTDILNTFGLLNYFYSLKIWNIIYTVIKEDANDFVSFFIKDKPGLCLVAISHEEHNLLTDEKNSEIFHNKIKKIINTDQYDTLFTGVSDIHNTNHLRGRWKYDKNFVRQFYQCYNINYGFRVSLFCITRDKSLEEEKYNKFIEQNGKNYIITHLVTAGEVADEPKDCKIIDINQFSSILFDCVKILEEARELHLIDSVWGVLVYLLSAKYNLFTDKKIVIYTKRSWEEMFYDPIRLPNFQIK
jgi:hypothetical protein